MKKQLIRLAAITVLGLSLTTGFAAAQTGSINTTGADSYNKVKSRVHNVQRVRNTNTLAVDNANQQAASTGAANSSQNTTGGGAGSGTATNATSFSVAGSVNNSPSSSAAMAVPAAVASASANMEGTIDNTGYNSTNVVSSHVSNKTAVENDNCIMVTNDNTQSASSGTANVSQNTTGGSATSGNASNTNNTSVTLSVTN